MDIQRPELGLKRRRRRIIYGAVAVVVLILITVAISRLEPAAPSVERSTVLIDTVKRGSMLRQVRGAGTLVPEDVRLIPATTDARVERIVVLPGTTVTPDTVILELSNPEVQQQALAAQMDLRRAQAQHANLRIQLESGLMTQRSAAAQVETDYLEAKLRAERDDELVKLGLVSDLDHRISRGRAESLAVRHRLEQERLGVAHKAIEAQMEAAQAEVEQRQALYELRRDQVEALRVRPGMSGVLQRVPVEVGQQVAVGTNLAQVADPARLKAQLRIPATQARDILLGQKAEVDTRNGIIPGHVIRIDPAVQDGTVTVDVALDAALPRGARPDLNVDGTVELERLENILYVGRPAFGQESTRVGLFKLIDGGRGAVRVQVELGRSSVNLIEIREGLQEGEQVILSDMSAWDAYDRVRLN
ncbi:MAG: efflux RND transporter periplasmic adaptor subunit [Candidatus Acidiferrales bacterium]